MGRCMCTHDSIGRSCLSNTAHAGAAATLSVATLTGTQDVAGTRWVVYQGAGTAEPVWTTRLQTPGAGSTQIALTGTGSTDEFRTLAEAVGTQSPLPAK